MRTRFQFVVVGIFFASASALAQPRPVYRNAPPPAYQPPPPAYQPQPQPQPVTPPAPMVRSPAQERFCASRQNIVMQLQQQSDSYRTELTSIDSELAQLQRRISDLNQRRGDVQNQMAQSDQRLQDQKSVVERDCAGRVQRGCASYDGMVDQLERERTPVEAEITRVRTDADACRRDVDRLSRQIQPLQQEFKDKSCDNLVAGSTEQTVIDRCSAIFSEWNRAQADVNQQNMRLSALKNRHEALMNQMRGLEQRASGYEQYMAQNCAGSRREVIVRGYGDVRRRAETTGQQLDQLVDTVNRLKGARISIGIQ